MPMGRRRQHRRDLPERVYFRHNAYYFVARNGEWIWLARDRAIALKKYADINASPIAGGMAAIIQRHIRQVTPSRTTRAKSFRSNVFSATWNRAKLPPRIFMLTWT